MFQAESLSWGNNEWPFAYLFVNIYWVPTNVWALF